MKSVGVMNVVYDTEVKPQLISFDYFVSEYHKLKLKKKISDELNIHIDKVENNDTFKGRKGVMIKGFNKVNLLCKELKVLKPQRNTLKKRIAINRTVKASNILWEVDIKYGYINGGDRFFYVLSYRPQL